MAVEYFIYSSLQSTDLESLLVKARADAGEIWLHASAHELHSQTVLMLKEDYGYSEEYKSSIYVRHNKDFTVEARTFTKAFFDALPSPKIAMLNGKIVDPGQFLT